MTLKEAQRVWDMAFSHWPEDAVFRYFARHPDGHVFGAAALSPEELVQATYFADSRGYNLYWMPNPTRKRTGTRCSTEDITHWSYFMVDIDPIVDDPEWSYDPVRLDIQMLLREYLGRMRLAYTGVFSGRGYQMLYALGPIDLSSLALPSIVGVYDSDAALLCINKAAPIAMSYWLDRLAKGLKEKASRINHAWTVDVSCSDLPRVMRMPFTINQKTGRRSTLEYHPKVNTSLAQDLLEGVPPELWIPRKEIAPLGLQSSWQHYLPHMTSTGRSFVTRGATETTRHKNATAAMLSLIELGASRDQVLAALSFGAHMCQPPLPEVDVLDMVKRRFRKI